MERRVIHVPGVAKESGLFSHCIAAQGETLYISGQIPVDLDGKLVGPGDFEAQAHQVFANLQQVLEAAGAAFSDVVKFTVYLTKPEHAKQYGAVRKQYLTEPYPTSTAVVVSALLSPDWLVEVEAVAVVDPPLK